MTADGSPADQRLPHPSDGDVTARRLPEDDLHAPYRGTPFVTPVLPCLDRRRTSASVILRSVLEHGPVARSTISRLTGLSPASVTDYCARFTELGLIREAAAPRRSNGVGRPHVPVDLDDSRFVVGGVHVAVPYTTVALLDLRGRVLAATRLKHERTEPGRCWREPPTRSAPCWTAPPAVPPLGVGVAVGGWVDRDSGTVVEHPLLGWRDVPVREVLGARTGLPVHVDGHARALVNAERLFGRARGSRSVLHLFVGNVVDAAFATHDEVHHGPRSQAGAIAHLPVPGGSEPCDCGRTGCLQAELSERTLCRRARRAGCHRRRRTRCMWSRRRPPATRWPYGCWWSGRGCVGRAARLLLDVLNPETVVVTEIGVMHREDCLAALREAVGTGAGAVRRCPPVSRIPCSPWRAVSVALDVLYRDPLGSGSRQALSHLSAN